MNAKIVASRMNGRGQILYLIKVDCQKHGTQVDGWIDQSVQKSDSTMVGIAKCCECDPVPDDVLAGAIE